MTSDEQRSHWDSKYEQGLPSLERPDPFFISAFNQFVADRFPSGGTALDLAGGVGRHALWLATRSWQVTVIDISDVAIQKLAEKARKLDLTLNLYALDASALQFEPDSFDLIVMFYHFDRGICARVCSALKPGGLLICKSSLMWNSYEGPATPNLRPLEKGEVLTQLPELQVMIHTERPVRDRGVVEFVGLKQGRI
jgi:2-polyprenyl-3-methyl-5-hydroxy-6-metoxy-1,4-benzoquinol methylase